MTAIAGTWRLASASGKQLLRSSEVFATMIAFPGALLVILWLFSDLRFEFGHQAAPLIDFWVTGLGVLGVALGKTHAFLATISTWKGGGVLKRISVTPIGSGQLIVGEVIPRAVLGIVTLVAFLLAGNALGADVRMGAELLQALPVMVMVTVTGSSDMGTPQGSSLSPLLSNVMLDDLDKELERRGHRFVRFADDIRIYVASERAAHRVLEGVSAFIERRLKLRVNADKSGVAPATKRGLLGFCFFRRKGEVKVRIDPKARKAMKERIRRLTACSWGISMAQRITVLNRYIQGWCAYFALADTPSSFAEFEEWLRRRLRQLHWKQWKRPKIKRRKLRALGIPAQKAYEWSYTSKGSWRVAGSAPLQRAMPKAYWVGLGLQGFGDRYGYVREVWRTA